MDIANICCLDNTSPQDNSYEEEGTSDEFVQSAS